MKKILALTSLIFALSVGATAMAADESEVPNVASGVDYTTTIADGFATVLVQGPGEATDIVYVDQADSVFGASLNLMLKAGINDGTYTIKFGGAGKEATSRTFTLKTATTDPDPAPTTIPMTAAKETVYPQGKNIAFETSVTTAVNAVKFTVNDETGAQTATIPLINAPAVISGGMYADCVVLVTGIPNDVTVTAELLYAE